MRRCVVIAGAPVEAYEEIGKMLREDDFIICCDGGLRHLKGLQREADLIVGDFDSWENPNLPTETIVLPHEKDDTDSFYAVKEAVNRGFRDFLLLGFIGRRFDHSMGNISVLVMLEKAGINAKIVDDYSEMEVISDTPKEISDDFPYFSVLSIDGKASGITITGALYPLTDSELTPEYQYAISNETLPGHTAVVSVKEGRLLLIRVREG